MKEDFVHFDLAKKLKEKGFKFNKDYRLDRFFMANEINTPTITQALKWLREEKGLHICISCCIDPLSEWNYEIVEIDGVIFKHADDGYGSYEEAAKAGISYVLDNLI